MADLVELRTLTPSQPEAERIAAALVDGGLCAYAHLEPVDSRFVWQGEVQQGPEWRLSLGCRAELTQQITQIIRELHSYQLPAVYALRIEGGDPEWLQWLADHSEG